MILQPNEKRVVSVTVAALIGETIKIKVEVTKTDPLTQEKEINNVFGKLMAEIPKISLLNPLSVEMKPVEDERLKCQGVMVLQNNGRAVVPLKLTLTQSNHLEADMFYLDRDKTTTVTYRLEPGQTLRQVVNCLTPPIFECSRITGQMPVTAQVQVTLATSAQVKLPPITTTTFTARLSPNFFSVPASLTMASDSPQVCQVYNSGPQPYSFQATATIGFYVQPTVFTAQPRQTVTLTVTSMGRSFRKGTLTLHASELHSKSSGKLYTVHLQGTGSYSVSNSASATPQNSRPTSPTSPSGSIAEGGLQLACTHKELVWGGCSLQKRVVKSCSLKNQNSHREKLRLSLSGPHNCFKILAQKKTMESEMLVSLQPMEKYEVSVVMLAASPGPKWGHLTISRLNQPQDKKVLLLYAFGGKALVNIEGVMTDPEHHMWLYLDPDTLCSTFILTNTGDYTAFFKICEGMSATTVGGGLSVSPPEQILERGHSVSVDINLSVTTERLEYLLAQSSQKAICITRLTVTSGDESTRQRLSQLSRVQPKLAEKLFQLNQLPATPIPDLDRLGDPTDCAETLWLEDVSEWTIGVLVERSALEAQRLDTTVKFVDLATTVLHG
uniref:Cep192/Spd-2-like domain-containing protein n=3 Tax=Graphocephala atropunctata TaxID=36148 RepID=A0A1B6KQB6_9HEMI